MTDKFLNGKVQQISAEATLVPGMGAHSSFNIHGLCSLYPGTDDVRKRSKDPKGKQNTVDQHV